MEALLPSEIARLVLGYLEDQKCNEAARSFLEASPHLQECRTAVLSGRRFNTRVNGCTLVEIFDKFAAAHSLVQERLSKVADCEQVRQCGDLLEQLRFLIGESRGQRFVVNINVPSQANSQTYDRSPLITSSIRRRHHSSSDRDRSKRNQKSLHQLFERQPEPVSSQLGYETVEATSLESLPGHTNSNRPHRHEQTATQESDGVYCTSTKNDFVDDLPSGELQSISKQICHNPSYSQHQEIKPNNLDAQPKGCSPVLVLDKEKRVEEHMDDGENRNSAGKGKTMATSTDELTTYSSIEVQTTPYAFSDSESIGLDDEPIENLSLLTKELLNRTELQERIAENINKAILPIEMPSKDESICESMGGELNTSIMAELNNAIKSIVTATETDPIFEHFLDEIIGPNTDTDTSPDEDPDMRAVSEPAATSRVHEEPSNTEVVDMDLEEDTAVTANKGSALSGPTEVPLKQRLRSSSRQQNNKFDDDGEKPKEVEKTDSSLEDYNAAAIMSIINANIVSETQAIEKGHSIGSCGIAKPEVLMQPTEFSRAESISSESQVVDSTELVANDCADGISTKIPNAEEFIGTKLNPEPKIDQHAFITEQEMMAMPTLIVCSQEEMRNSMNANNLYTSAKAAPSCESRFVPIAPKGSEGPRPITPLYLRAVQVPVQIPGKIEPVISDTKVQSMKMKPVSPAKISSTNKKRNRKATKKPKNPVPSKPVTTNVTVDVETSSFVSKVPTTSNTDLESITFYGNDTSFGAMIETGNMPVINLDDSMTLTGTGLSPYLKFNDSKSYSQKSDLPCEKLSNQDPIEEPGPVQNSDIPVLPNTTDDIIITRRTPKSLLKSRSKNNRLSLSTPRRRSSHVRALDFNTPIKISNSEHKSSGNKNLQFSSKLSKRARSVCRTSLFKSPPFSKSLTASENVTTPVDDRQLYKVPIATRSPAPKLMGGWDKYTGVGMILGGTSPHPSSSSSVLGHEEACSSVKSSSSTVKKSWDADLRQSLQVHEMPAGSTSVAEKAPVKLRSRAVQNSSVDVEEKVLMSKSNKPLTCNKIAKQRKLKKNTDQIPTQPADKMHDNIPNTLSKAQNSSQVLTQEKCILAKSTNQELGVDGDAQIGNLPSQNQPVPGSKRVITASDLKSIQKGSPEIEDSNETKPIVKKYAKLKTLETQITKSRKGAIIESVVSCTADSSQKKFEYLTIMTETRSQPAHTSQMVDLETPRKTANCTGIPPTPRLLSPSSSTITPFTKIAEELSKVHSFVSTPDFPPTPSIALTPKGMGENTIDAIKKGDYGTGSPYYQPSNEQPDILEKSINNSNNLKENAVDVLPVISSVNIDTGTLGESRDLASDFGMSISSSKLEITQFEVIKENLPKGEADKELKISTNMKNADEALPKLDDPTPSKSQDSTEVKNEIERSSKHEDSSSSSENESSDSSSSDTSSSSSCSSSCSCSSIATTSTPFKSTNKCRIKSNTYRDTSNDCGSKNVPSTTMIDHNLLNDISPIISHAVGIGSQNTKGLMVMEIASSFSRGETSPTKLVPVMKTQEEVDASAKETPAKDEALLSEANISETPSSSKSGIESLTNLNSKISALDSSRDQINSRHTQSANKIHVLPLTRSKPKIVSIQHLLPDVSVALKPALASEIITSTSQSCILSTSTNAPDGKLGSHLEEKRLRLMAKLKNKPEPKIMPQKAKNKYKDKHEIPKSSVSVRKNSIRETASRSPIQKGTKKKLDVKNAKILTKQETKNRVDRKASIIRPKAKVSCQEQKYDKCNTKERVNKLKLEQEGSITEKKDDIESLKSKKSARLVDHKVIQNIEENQCSDVIPVTNIRLQRNKDLKAVKINSKQCPTTQPVNDSEVIKDCEVDSRTIHPVNSTKSTLSISRRRDSTLNKDSNKQVDVFADQLQKVLPSCSRDEDYVVENVIPMKKNQIVPISKVDQIKRDLFSDEENSDQRTTRSRTRQLSDAQKNDHVIAVPESDSQTEPKICQSVAKKPKEELASVLECLKLVPANKNEMIGKSNASPKASINKLAEFEFIYDDSIPITNKRLKFSSKSLKYIINIELPDENYREYPKLMSPTNYEEIFNISPKPKKRVVAKKLAVKNSKAKVTKDVGTILKNELTKPSPTISSSTQLKPPTSKLSKSSTKIQHKSLKPTDKDDKKKLKDDNQVITKRKMTDCEEDQSGVKKRRVADPQTLLKKLDLDLFLTSVHGPI